MYETEAAVTASSGHHHHLDHNLNDRENDASGDNTDHDDDDNVGGSKGYSSQKGNKSVGNICSSSYATEHIMTRCLGKRNCSLEANHDNLGKPDGCLSGTQFHLKVTYACLPRDVLKGYIFSTMTPMTSSWTTTTTTTTTASKTTQSKDDLEGFLGSPRFIPEADTKGSGSRPVTGGDHSFSSSSPSPVIYTPDPSSIPTFYPPYSAGRGSESPMTQLAKEMKRYREEGKSSRPNEGSKGDQVQDSGSDFVSGHQNEPTSYRVSNPSSDHRVISISREGSKTAGDQQGFFFPWMRNSFHTFSFFRGKMSCYLRRVGCFFIFLVYAFAVIVLTEDQLNLKKGERREETGSSLG